MSRVDVEPGVLYLVPTPLGNDADLTQRAIEVLGRVDVIAAEDTRNAKDLLRRLGIHKPLVSYFDHNESARAPRLVEQILGGSHVALISDAGTPVVSDPGYRIVDHAIRGGVTIVPLPGPSAAVTALIASGLPSHRFAFTGFLPRVAGQRQKAIEELRRLPFTLVLYEAPHRVVELLRSLEEGLGDRRAALAFELTKPRERFVRGALSEVRATLEAGGEWMGEMTLVVAGAEGELAEDWERAEVLMRSLLGAGVEVGVVRDAVSAAFELPRRAVYQRALSIAKGAGEGEGE